MSRRTALAAAIVATVTVTVGICWLLHPAAGLIYAGTVIQLACLLLVPVEVGGLRR